MAYSTWQRTGFCADDTAAATKLQASSSWRMPPHPTSHNQTAGVIVAKEALKQDSP